MKLYLDDNSADAILLAMLQKAGHVVTIPANVGRKGASDARHFEYSIRAGLILVTADEKDFQELNDVVEAAGGRHPGLLIVRYENDSKRDMKPKHVAAAINKLAKSGFDVSSQVIILNQWR